MNETWVMVGAVAALAATGILGAASGAGPAAAGKPDRPPRVLAWSATEGLTTKHFRVPSEGDGVVAVVDAAGRKALRSRGRRSQYVYFDLRAPLEAARVYVVVEFLDRGLGPIVLQYDSRRKPGAPLEASYRPAEVACGAMRLDGGGWRKAAFELHRPQFRGRQNHGCDFRLFAPGGLTVAAVRVSDAPPADYAEIRAAARREAGHMVRPARGVEITVGGYDNFEVSQTRAWRGQLDQALPVLRALGATSHETYVVWRACEPARGRWDWSHYDACVAAHKSAGLKWVPFVILGPSYSLPKWFYDSKEHFGYRCLAHGQETSIQSLWHPATRRRVDAFLKAFAERYGRSGLIESVLLGITGNFGEAIYPVSDGSSRSWTSRPHGPYHSHPGMWCGDRYAVADFRKWLRAKYPTIDRLNAAWATKHGDWSAISPIAGPRAAGRRAWLDTVDWYRQTMTRWAEFWLQATRKHMPPGTEIYLCTGGHAPPEHGSEFGVQSKLAAACGAGVRITNEASNYPLNFSITRWVASACRFYGTFFGYEPAGGVDAKGVVARIYNATCSGAKQLHHYPNNLLGDPAALAKWKRYGHLMKLRRPKVDVAVWYANRMVDLRAGDILARLRQMREVCDYDIVDARMILDGALDRYRILVCVSPGPYERDTLAKVDGWLRRGGHLYLPKAEAFAIRAVEGGAGPAESWLECKTAHWLATDRRLGGFFQALRKRLAAQGVLVTGIRGVYATAFRDGSAMLLNMNDQPHRVSVGRRTVDVPGAGIVEVPAEGAVRQR